MRVILAVFLALLIQASIAAAGEKRIYIALDDHTDLEWSADAETYRKAFLDMLD